MTAFIGRCFPDDYPEYSQARCELQCCYCGHFISECKCEFGESSNDIEFPSIDIEKQAALDRAQSQVRLPTFPKYNLWQRIIAWFFVKFCQRTNT